MYRLTFILLLLFAQTQAKEVGLLRVHCDPEFDTIHDFYLSLDEQDNVFSIIRCSLRSQTVFPNSELRSKDVVIASLKDKNVILLSCPNYNPSFGGAFVIKYLHNGLTNSYKKMTLWLEKDQQGWHLTTPPPHKNRVSAIKVVPRKIAGITIGVQNLHIVQ